MIASVCVDVINLKIIEADHFGTYVCST